MAKISEIILKLEDYKQAAWIDLNMEYYHIQQSIILLIYVQFKSYG